MRFFLLMNMNKKLFLNVIGLAIVVMTCTMCQRPTASLPSSPEEALAELEEPDDSIRRFLEKKLTDPQDRKQVKKLAADVMEEFGRIDVLVNNAGIAGQCLIQDVTPETTLESHLYYMETSEISYEVLCQLKARVRLNYPVRKGGSVLYREKILKIQELAALSPAEKKRQDLRLAELQLSKLALMQFSF